MLDAATPLPVPGVEVLAWADLDSPDVVWALPVRPRIAAAADGLPDVSLLLYRRGAASQPDGGQLNLTVDLALTSAERAAAADAAAARRPEPPPGEPPLPPVEVRAPQWLDGTVHAELLPGLTADGQPSLLGDNACVLALQLDAGQAADVGQAWDAGFPDATVELAGAVDGAAGAATAAAGSCETSSTTTGPAAASASTSRTSVTVGAGARNAVRVPLRLRGPLRLPPTARSARRTDLTL